ncbi:ABC-type nitrate/sulfonate/bicarbonate transport system substrate-binding protein [Embleya sp. AB8]
MSGLDKLIKKATDYAKQNPDKVKSIVEKVKKQAEKRKGS